MAYGSKLKQNIYYNSPYLFKNLMSSLYGFIKGKQRYGAYFEKYFKELIESQWFTNSQLKSLQYRRTKDFLINAYHHSPYYRNVFRACGFSPHKMKAIEDFCVVPIATKHLVRKNIESICNDEPKKYQSHINHTGGTTGASLVFPESKESFQREYAYRYLQYSWGGCFRGQKFAFCVGHPITYKDRKKPPFWVYDLANNWLCLSSFHLNEKNIKHYILKLKEFEPQLLQGYPSSMYLLAIANNHFGKIVNPQAIFTSSETLADFQRSTIEQSFGCKVFSYYGNAERCGFFAQCEEGNYHSMLQHSCIEILDDNNVRALPGTPGRLVATGFGNYSTPLIRYDVGDTVVESTEDQCECGRGGTIIKDIVGRTDDYILTPEGRLVGRLSPVFHNAVRVKSAQIIQNDISEIIIRIVREPGYSHLDEEDLLSKARFRFGSKINISFDYVSDIPRTRNGKHRFIVSNIDKKALFGEIVDY